MKTYAIVCLSGLLLAGPLFGPGARAENQKSNPEAKVGTHWISPLFGETLDLQFRDTTVLTRSRAALGQVGTDQALTLGQFGRVWKWSEPCYERSGGFSHPGSGSLPGSYSLSGPSPIAEDYCSSPLSSFMAPIRLPSYGGVPGFNSENK